MDAVHAWAKLAHFGDTALQHLPPGTQAAPPELLRWANQTMARSDEAVVRTHVLVFSWLEREHNRRSGATRPLQ